MLAATRISDAVMIDVDYLNFGKLVAAPGGHVRPPEGLGVTRRSRGLKPDQDGELRLSTLLDVQVFSPAMIDAALAGTGPLLVRTLPRAAAWPQGRAVFVRARFRQETDGGSDSRMHQQASVWVVQADMWRQHPVAILAKVSKELRAEPDRVDEPGRFGAPPKEVSLDGGATENWHAGNTPEENAYYRILDMLLPQRIMDSRTKDREVSFGADVFETEAGFLAVVGRALQALPDSFSEWNDICVSSGLRQSRGGLLIRYLPSEPTPSGVEIDIISVQRRLKEISGTIDRVSEWSPAKRVLSSTRQAAAQPAADAASNPRGAALTFDLSLAGYRDNGEPRSARELVEAAKLVSASGRGELRRDIRGAFDAVIGAFSAPQCELPWGTLFDRALLLSSLSRSTEFSWSIKMRAYLEALVQAISGAGILLPAEIKHLEQDRQISDYVLDHYQLTQIVRDSGALAAWLDKEGRSAYASIPDVSVFKNLHRRLPAILVPWSAQDDCGVHAKVLVKADAILSPSEVAEAKDNMLRATLSLLCTVRAQSGPRHSTGR
jgi:hypothetical protein